MVYTQAVVGTVLPFEAQVTGRAQSMVWDFGDGTRVTNLFDVPCVYKPGELFCNTDSLQHDGQAGATAIVHIVKSPTYYYVATNGNDLAAGRNWTAAKATIQTAIDAAIPGDTVWVTKGVYASGGTSQLSDRFEANQPGRSI